MLCSAIEAVVIVSPLQLTIIRLAMGWGEHAAKAEWWNNVLSVLEAIPLVFLLGKAFPASELPHQPLAEGFLN
jgi:hypothetical protein